MAACVVMVLAYEGVAREPETVRRQLRTLAVGTPWSHVRDLAGCNPRFLDDIEDAMQQLHVDRPVVASLRNPGMSVLGYSTDPDEEFRHAVVVVEITDDFREVVLYDPAGQQQGGATQPVRCDFEEFDHVWEGGVVLRPVRA